MTICIILSIRLYQLKNEDSIIKNLPTCGYLDSPLLKLLSVYHKYWLNWDRFLWNWYISTDGYVDFENLFSYWFYIDPKPYEFQSHYPFIIVSSIIYSKIFFLLLDILWGLCFCIQFHIKTWFLLTILDKPLYVFLKSLLDSWLILDANWLYLFRLAIFMILKIYQKDTSIVLLSKTNSISLQKKASLCFIYLMESFEKYKYKPKYMYFWRCL